VAEQKERRSGMWTVLLIFLIGAVPFFGAWYLVEHPRIWGTQGNRGRLIQPPVPVEYDLFHSIGGQTANERSLTQIRGRWVIIHPVVEDNLEACRKTLEDTRRLHPLFSKDIPRVRRLAIWSDDTAPSAELLQGLLNDRDLYLAQVDRSFYDRLSRTIIKAPLRCGQVIIMDPLGNMMMWYDARFDPFDLYHDLKRLLRASQIG